MKKNVGDMDAYLRLLMGFSTLGYGMMRRSTIPVFIGSMKIAEGITRYCPMLDTIGLSTTKDNNQNEQDNTLEN